MLVLIVLVNIPLMVVVMMKLLQLEICKNLTVDVNTLLMAVVLNQLILPKKIMQDLIVIHLK